MIEKDLRVLVKSGSENRKPIRDGYSPNPVLFFFDYEGITVLIEYGGLSACPTSHLGGERILFLAKFKDGDPKKQ